VNEAKKKFKQHMVKPTVAIGWSKRYISLFRNWFKTMNVS